MDPLSPLSPPSPSSPPANPPKGKEEACKTYIEQTKLLVTLSSAFLAAPPAVLGLLWGKDGIFMLVVQQWLFLSSEICFVLSVLVGYVVLGALAGSQDDGSFDVYRPATRFFSVVQLLLYIGGLLLFVLLIRQLTG